MDGIKIRPSLHLLQLASQVGQTPPHVQILSQKTEKPGCQFSKVRLYRELLFYPATFWQMFRWWRKEGRVETQRSSVHTSVQRPGLITTQWVYHVLCCQHGTPRMNGGLSDGICDVWCSMAGTVDGKPCQMLSFSISECQQ